MVVRGPSCILEGALRFATALFGERMDRWSLVRERLTHVVSVSDSPCTLKKPAEPNIGQYHTRYYLRSRKSTPAQSGITVIETPFIHYSASRKRPDGLWLHEHCGTRRSAEHDIGRIVISEPQIPGTVNENEHLKVKLDISEEGLLFRKPVLETSCGEQIPITWESSNLSFSKDMMNNVRAQLAEEMKTSHST
jgi:hypothetical protein